MKTASLILGMRMGNMGYMSFSLVSHKGAEGPPLPPLEIQIPVPPILMKFKSYVLDTK